MGKYNIKVGRIYSERFDGCGKPDEWVVSCKYKVAIHFE